MPIAAVMLCLGLTALWRHPKLSAINLPVRVGMCIILAYGVRAHVKQVDTQAMEVGSVNGVDSIGWLKIFAEQCQFAGEWLKEHAPANASLATTAAGTIPFFSGLYTVDILGLNDEWIAHEVAPKGNRPGHTRSAPSSYLASKAVDYLIYHPQFFEKSRQSGGRTLTDTMGKRVRYAWRIEKLYNMNPPFWGFWEKQSTP